MLHSSALSVDSFLVFLFLPFPQGNYISQSLQCCDLVHFGPNVLYLWGQEVHLVLAEHLS